MGVLVRPSADMTVPSLEKMMNIVQIMSFHIATKGDKVAVHCHAGYGNHWDHCIANKWHPSGRTGIAVASYLVYALGLPCTEVCYSFDTHPHSRQPAGHSDCAS